MNRHWGYSKSQWLLFSILAIANLITCMVNSIQAPIFPREVRYFLLSTSRNGIEAHVPLYALSLLSTFQAIEKGATATEYGLVFGVFALTQCFLSPVVGSFTPRFGILWVLSAGVLVAGVSTILFGFLQFVNDRWIFITLAVVLRIVQAVGASAVYVSIYSCIPNEFPESVATTIGTMEGLVGLAFSAGPFLGSALFQVGGFILPFHVLGGSLILIGPLACYVLRKTGHQGDAGVAKNSDDKSLGFFAMLKAVPSINFYMMCVLVGAINIGFNETLLEPHLQQFRLTPISVGLVFLLLGGSNALGAPIFSYLCGHIKIPDLIPLIGAFFAIIGLILIGPAPFLPLKPSMALTLSGIVFAGVAVACYLSSGFILSMKAAEESGFSDIKRTSAQISGLWIATISFGTFIGPIIGGVLYDTFGYPMGSLFIIGLDLAQGLSVVIFILSRKCKSKIHLTNGHKLDENVQI